MNRREFSTQLVAAGVGLSAAVIAAPTAAQFVPVEGTHYVRLS